MDLFEAIKKRASVRSLAPADIPDADLETILDAGRRAASGMNVQPFSFILVKDRETINKLGEVQGFVRDASALIAIVADPEASKYWLEDISAATENMLLAITALDYASTWVEGTLLRKEDEMKGVLGVPENLRLMIFIPLGKAAGSANQAAKKSLDEMVWHEKYGCR